MTLSRNSGGASIFCTKKRVFFSQSNRISIVQLKEVQYWMLFQMFLEVSSEYHTFPAYTRLQKFCLWVEDLNFWLIIFRSKDNYTNFEISIAIRISNRMFRIITSEKSYHQISHAKKDSVSIAVNLTFFETKEAAWICKIVIFKTVFTT